MGRREYLGSRPSQRTCRESEESDRPLHQRLPPPLHPFARPRDSAATDERVIESAHKRLVLRSSLGHAYAALEWVWICANKILFMMSVCGMLCLGVS